MLTLNKSNKNCTPCYRWNISKDDVKQQIIIIILFRFRDFDSIHGGKLTICKNLRQVWRYQRGKTEAENRRIDRQ